MIKYKMLTWRSEGKNKNTNILIKILKSPVTALLKVSNIYTNSMSSCSHKLDQNAVANFSFGPQVVIGTAQNPARNFMSDSKRRDDLIRAVSKKPRIRKIGKNDAGRAEQQRAGPVVRSYSVGIGTIGRIDEDAPCEFHANVSKARGV